MGDVEQVIEDLLAKWRGGFRNKHLAEALGVSRARASQLLAMRELSGELSRIGENRGRYIRGRYGGHRKTGFARGAMPAEFWSALAACYPKLAYLSLGGLGLQHVRTRQQIRTALRGVSDRRPDFLVIDFEDVQTISHAAARALLIDVPSHEHILYVEPINMRAPLALTVWRVIRFAERAGLTNPWEQRLT